MAKLKNICTFYAGTGFPVKYQGQVAGQYAFYKVGDISDSVRSGKIYLDGSNNYISNQDVKEIKGTIIPKDTVVFAKIGEAVRLNRRAITSENCLVDNNVMGIAPDQHRLSLRYFFYFMKMLKMEVLAESTTVPSVRKTKLEDIDIYLPNMDKQNEISDLLDNVDFIIRLKRQQIEELDDLVKSRFVEMFGTYPANEKRWETGIIRDLVTDVRYGSSRKASDGKEGQYPYLRMNNITYSGELDLTEIKTIDIPEDELPKCSVQRGDVLFNRTNSKELVGKTCVYNRDEMMVLAGFVIRIRVNDRVLPEFLSSYLNMDFSKAMLLSMCKAAIGQANINAQELQNIGIYIPSISEQKLFVAFKNKIDKSKFNKMRVA